MCLGHRKAKKRNGFCSRARLPIPLSLPKWQRRSICSRFIFLKLEWLASYVASVWLLLRILQRTSAEPAYGIFLFALNPLLLLELLVTGHNDILVILFALLSLLFLQKQRGALALWAALLCA